MSDKIDGVLVQLFVRNNKLDSRVDFNNASVNDVVIAFIELSIITDQLLEQYDDWKKGVTKK